LSPQVWLRGESLQGHMICPYTKTQVQNIFLNTEFVYEPFQQEMF